MTECHETKSSLTESPFNRTPIDRKFILPKDHITDLFFKKWSKIESTFDKKKSFDRKKIAQKVVLPKIHLIESSFDQNLFLNIAFRVLVILN
jgi:hypothetical protein